MNYEAIIVAVAFLVNYQFWESFTKLNFLCFVICIKYITKYIINYISQSFYLFMKRRNNIEYTNI